MKLDIIVIANALATLIVAGVIAWARYREKRVTAKMLLADNPLRCVNHAERLAALEKQISGLETQAARLEERIAELQRSINRMENKSR